MKQIDILETLDDVAAKVALIATYDFAPLFFERRMLRKKALASADRILILMDKGRYRELVAQGLPVSGFNRRYLVVPIDRHPFVFHPKCYLFVGDARAIGIVGSNNATGAGIAFNMELCSTFKWGNAESDGSRGESANVLRQIFGAFRDFSLSTGGFQTTIEKEFFRPIETLQPWMHPDAVSVGEKDRIELIHSHQKPLWPQLHAKLKDLPVKKITVVAPFFDKNVNFLKTLKSAWPSAQLSIFAQQRYATLQAKRLKDILNKKTKDTLWEVMPPTGRRLHAKAFAFEIKGSTIWVTGSANATDAAFRNGNTEAVLYFSTKDIMPDALASEGLDADVIDPDKFESGEGSEPTNDQEPADALLHLESVTLQKNGTAEILCSVSKEVSNVVLRIRNFNENQPFLSLRLSRPTEASLHLDLDENQISQINGAAICELKGTAARAEIISNAVALVQLNQILKPRSEGRGSTNPLRKISETGEDLVPFLDQLGSIRDVIQFLDNCSIRYEDGNSNGRSGGKPFWKPRDPFVSDAPAQWLLAKIDSLSEELKDAIWDFVTRHQHDKLGRHIKVGNLNGLPNFLDIFRTLNGLLLSFHNRKIEGDKPVVPAPYVTEGIRTNIDLLIGYRDLEDQYVSGFVDSILRNHAGDRGLVRQRLLDEHLPQMLRAATEAMIDVRCKAMKLTTLDNWSVDALKRVEQWLLRQGFEMPSVEDVQKAGAEYKPISIAA